MLYRRQYYTGFTLIEIMVAMAIIAVLAAIAIPAYNGYVHTARMVEGRDSIASLHLAQVEFFEENGFFFIGNTTAAAETLITASNGLWNPVPWQQALPLATNLAALNFTYVVVNCAGGATVAAGNPGAGNPTQCYTITATGWNMLTAADTLTESN